MSIPAFMMPASVRLWRSSIGKRSGVRTQQVLITQIRSRVTQELFGLYTISDEINRVARRAVRLSEDGEELPADLEGMVDPDGLPFESVVELDEDFLMVEDEDAEDAAALAYDWSGVRTALAGRGLQSLGLGIDGIDVYVQVVTSDLNGDNPDPELQAQVLAFLESTSARFVLEDWLLGPGAALDVTGDDVIIVGNSLTASTPVAQQSGGSAKPLSSGAIAGTVIGAVFGACLMLVLLVLLFRKYGGRREAADPTEDDDAPLYAESSDEDDEEEEEEDEDAAMEATPLHAPSSSPSETRGAAAPSRPTLVGPVSVPPTLVGPSDRPPTLTGPPAAFAALTPTLTGPPLVQGARTPTLNPPSDLALGGDAYAASRPPFTGPAALGRRTLPRTSPVGTPPVQAAAAVAAPPASFAAFSARSSSNAGLTARASPVASDDVLPTIYDARESLARLAAGSVAPTAALPARPIHPAPRPSGASDRAAGLATQAPAARPSGASDQAAESARQALARLAALSGQRATALDRPGGVGAPLSPELQRPRLSGAGDAAPSTATSGSFSAPRRSLDVARESLARLAASKPPPPLRSTDSTPGSSADRVTILSPSVPQPSEAALAAAAMRSPPMRRVQTVPGDVNASLLSADDDAGAGPMFEPRALGDLSWDGGVVTGRSVAPGLAAQKSVRPSDASRLPQPTGTPPQ